MSAASEKVIKCLKNYRPISFFTRFPQLILNTSSFASKLLNGTLKLSTVLSLYNSHSFLLRNSLITSRNEGLRNMCDWFYYRKLLSFAHHEHFDTRKRTSQRTRSEQGRTEPRVDSACGPRSCLKGQKMTVFTKCPGRADPEDSRFIGGASHERHGRTVRTPQGHQLPTAS